MRSSAFCLVARSTMGWRRNYEGILVLCLATCRDATGGHCCRPLLSASIAEQGAVADLSGCSFFFHIQTSPRALYCTSWPVHRRTWSSSLMDTIWITAHGYANDDVHRESDGLDLGVQLTRSVDSSRPQSTAYPSSLWSLFQRVLSKKKRSKQKTHECLFGHLWCLLILLGALFWTSQLVRREIFSKPLGSPGGYRSYWWSFSWPLPVGAVAGFCGPSIRGQRAGGRVFHPGVFCAVGHVRFSVFRLGFGLGCTLRGCPRTDTQMGFQDGVQGHRSERWAAAYVFLHRRFVFCETVAQVRGWSDTKH